MTRGPAAWILALLRAVAPRAEADFVLGDLEEEFHRRTAATGRTRATLWLAWEATRTGAALVTYDGEGMMTGWERDFRGALRLFRRAPGFAAVVVVTLAVGVGAATAVYGVLRGVVLTPLEFEDPDRVVMLWGQTPEYPRAPLTVGDFNALVDGVEAFAATSVSWGNTALLLGDGPAEQVRVGWVGPDYMAVLGVHPVRGRTLAPDDEAGLLLSHDLWVRRWGADPGVVGTTVDLAGVTMEVVGVLPPDRNPNLASFAGTRTDYDMWRLMPADWIRGDDRSVGWLRATARLHDGVTLAQAQAETDALMTAVNATVTDRDGGTDLRVNLVPAKGDLVGGVSRTLWILLAAVLGVLLIAASNIAHLLLSRGEGRGAEVAVRAALGGSRMRLLRQFGVESGVLALVGGVLGMAMAWLSLDLLLALAPANLPRLERVGLDWTVFAFALVATTAAALAAGVVPALRATRVDLAAAMAERRSSPTRRRQRLSQALVVAEVAVSLALLSATGLLLRSMSGLTNADLGFDPEGVLTFSIEADHWGDTPEEGAARLAAYEHAMADVAGVQAVGFSNRIPLGGGLFTGTYRSSEMVAAEAEPLEASLRLVTPGFFDALGARMLAGRNLRVEDGAEAVVVDELAAMRLWGDADVVGRRVEVEVLGSDPRMAEVVGVVAPMRHASVEARPEPTLFVSMLPTAHRQNVRNMAVRVAGDPLARVDDLRAAARSVNGATVLAGVRPLDDLVDESVAATRFATTLLVVFGAIALLLAAIGLHGVMACSVRRQRREIGIRVALGAGRGGILRRSVAWGTGLVVAGIVVGVGMALGSGRILDSLLYEVEPTDPVTLAGAAGLMLVVGLVGSYLPARQILRMDPVVTLREE